MNRNSNDSLKNPKDSSGREGMLTRNYEALLGLTILAADHSIFNKSRKEVNMLKNVHYDMVEEMAQVSRSLSRMDTYIKDSAG